MIKYPFHLVKNDEHYCALLNNDYSFHLMKNVVVFMQYITQPKLQVYTCETTAVKGCG